jgi:glycosyltransferase involved in cell wall biosynthesis
MSRSPLVSIGLPVFNAQKYLRLAIEAHLRQTCREFELIISDNASTDATAAICEEFARLDSRVRFVRSQENRGLTWNHLNVFRLSTGKYFRWAAADDIPSVDLLEETVGLLQADERVVLCVPRTHNIDGEGRVTGTLANNLELATDDPIERALAVLTRRYQMVFPQGLMRRDCLAQLLAPGREWNYFGWDLIILLELALRGRITQSRSAHLLRRLHEDQASRVQRDAAAGVGRIEPTFKALWVFPHWRWQKERFRAVARSPLTPAQRIKLYTFLGKQTWWIKSDLVRDLRMNLRLAWVGSGEIPL